MQRDTRVRYRGEGAREGGTGLQRITRGDIICYSLVGDNRRFSV